MHPSEQPLDPPPAFDRPLFRGSSAIIVDDVPIEEGCSHHVSLVSSSLSRQFDILKGRHQQPHQKDEAIAQFVGQSLDGQAEDDNCGHPSKRFRPDSEERPSFIRTTASGQQQLVPVVASDNSRQVDMLQGREDPKSLEIAEQTASMIQHEVRRMQNAVAELESMFLDQYSSEEDDNEVSDFGLGGANSSGNIINDIPDEYDAGDDGVGDVRDGGLGGPTVAPTSHLRLDH
jgi:hypothetical protein